MGEAIYAIDDFPQDDLLWRIEWIGGVSYNPNVPERSPNRRLPGADPGWRDESAQPQIAFLSNGFVLDFLLKALQVNFFSHRRHGGFLRFKIDTLDGGRDDLFDLARKMAGASIGTPLSEENG